MPALDDPRVAECLRRASRVHVAIATRRGPHVTPELFAVFRGRLWFATARRTLKARVTRRRPAVGLLAADGNRTLVARGEARPLDPFDPLGAAGLRSAADFLASPLAAALFTTRNAGHLAGFVAQGPTHWPRPGAWGTWRILVAVRLVAVAVVEDGRLVHASGDWGPAGGAGARSGPGGRAPAAADGTAAEAAWDLPPQAPPDVAGLPERRGERAVLGWEGPEGPLALPARWDPDERVAFVPAALVDVTGAGGAGDAAVTFDRMEGFAMAAKRGVMLRGPARLEPGWPEARVVVDPRAATWWEGQETHSGPTGVPAGGRADGAG